MLSCDGYSANAQLGPGDYAMLNAIGMFMERRIRDVDLNHRGSIPPFGHLKYQPYGRPSQSRTAA